MTSMMISSVPGRSLCGGERSARGKGPVSTGVEAPAVKLVLGGVGQQGDGAGLLDGARQLALERSRGAGETARDDLAAVRNELLKQAHVAVGDRVNLLHGELANLLAAEELTA